MGRPKKEDGKTETTALKKTQKPKDPLAPKRPMNSYMIWFSEHREELKNRYPDYPLGELSKIGGRRWREMDSAEKNEWQEIYNDEMKEYKEKMELYKVSKSVKESSSSGQKKFTMKTKKKEIDKGDGCQNFPDPYEFSDSD